MPNKVSRRGFLVAITGTAVAAAGCATRSYTPPTPYIPGSGIGASPTPSMIPTVDAARAIPNPDYGTVTYDKIFTTANDDLYITQWSGTTPNIDAATWQLQIDGLVQSPLTLDYATIKTFPVYEDMRTLECIGNPLGGDLIGNIAWRGFRFEEILNRVTIKPEATYVKFEAADGYSTGVKIDRITQPGVMLAYDMNGGPLTQKHGYPLRILIPGLYGQKMPRWIQHIEFIDYDYRGFWESHGWSNLAEVQTNSIIQKPHGGEVKLGQKIVIQGVAFAGKRAITNLEVSINYGEWLPATLVRGPSPLAWTQWYFTWTPSIPGDSRISVRASDDVGFTQTVEPQTLMGNPAPNGTSEIDSIFMHVSV